jgi:hypothetical protein
MRTGAHPPGQGVFKAVLPTDIGGGPLPAFPPSVHPDDVVGQPAEAGPYVIRIKVPATSS